MKSKDRIVIVVGVVLVLLFAGVLVNNYTTQSKDFWKQKYGHIAVTTQLYGWEMQAWFDENETIIEMVEENIVDSEMTQDAEFAEYLTDFAADHPDIIMAYIGFEDKTAVFGNGEPVPAGYDPTSRAWYKAAVASGDKPTFSEPYVSVTNNKVVVAVCHYITLSDGRKGVVAFDLSLDKVVSVMAAIKPYDAGTSFALDDKRNVITHSNSSYAPKASGGDTVFTNYDKDVTKTKKNKDTGFNSTDITIELYNINGQDTYVATAMMDEVGWYYGAEIPAAVFDDELGDFTASLILTTVLGLLIAIGSVAFCIIMVIQSGKKSHWYEAILDCLPNPLSVTDMDRNWTFINKPTEMFLGKKRADVKGQQCANWGAGICNTPNCGLNCLERGQLQTTFAQMGMDFKVDVNYLTDPKGNRIGHVEVVEDITEIMKMERLQSELIEHITELISNFTAVSREISVGAQSLADGSVTQASSIQELSSSIAEIAQKTKNSTKMAASAAELAGNIMRNAENGSEQMRQMIDAVNEINKAGESISQVIKVIDDIAFQTNILALNAAVEAARAGQHGKGFAVVAEEVRNLASKSAESAKNTSDLIANSLEKARLGTAIAKKTSESLDAIVAEVTESNEINSQMASSADEQSMAIEHINIAISGVNHIVQQNSATSEESAAAADQMREKVESLEEMVMNFNKQTKKK